MKISIFTFCLIFGSKLLWAQPSTFTSNLPILLIDTKGAAIPDEPKLTASMKIINNSAGQRNSITDETFEYNGSIGIELRGSSSQSFPKKPYGFETRDADGEDKDVSLFAWPKESDYILFASYNEKSLMHNVLSMHLAQGMGMYASRTQYLEVFLNNEYQGVYVLMEKIKRDGGRVDIAKLDPDENSGDDLTGGYILKIDKETGTSIGGFSSKYTNDFGTLAQKTYYQYEYPSEISNTQKDYIKNYIINFEELMNSPNYSDSGTGYASLIDVPSFVNFFIVNEVARNVDAYRISSFLYKDKDSNGGKLHAGPVWDFDISYGNADYCQGKRHDIFAYRFNEVCPNDAWIVPFWWYKLMADPAFVQAVGKQYHLMRADGVLKESSINQQIDEWQDLLQESQKRNFTQWPILGKYVWPNPEPIASTWDGEVKELRDWISLRLQWLDAQFPHDYAGQLLSNSPEPSFRFFPNPFIDVIHVDVQANSADKAKFQLFDGLGKIVFEEQVSVNQGLNTFSFKLPKNLAIQQVSIARLLLNKQVITHKLVRN